MSEWGIKVEMASEGKSALKKIKRRNFDMVLMDIQMPDMDGYETAERIRKMRVIILKQVPIIALTASTSDSTKHKIYKSGMQDVVLKPIVADELLTRISGACQYRRGNAAPQIVTELVRRRQKGKTPT